jgi:hypothetical protein
MFRALITPILKSTLYLQLLYDIPTLLPTGDCSSILILLLLLLLLYDIYHCRVYSE